MSTTALWAPDITPPDDWLIPALLYQDRIATFAPYAVRDDRDGREARRLRDLLGDLYKPVHFDPTFGEIDENALRDFIETARARKPLWLTYIKRRTDEQPDAGWLRTWANRASGWPTRHTLLHNMYQEAVEERRQTRQALDATEKDHQRILAEVSTRRTDVERQMTALEPQLRAERLARKQALAPLIARHQSFLRGRRGVDPDTEAMIRLVNAELKDLSESMQNASPTRTMYDALHREHSLLVAKEKASITAVTAVRDAASRAVERVRRQQSSLDRPWSGGRDLISWLDSRRIDSRPPELETIAYGKVYGPVFEFLANECGLWVAEDPHSPYVGTLVGPREVIYDIMEILAECFAVASPGWVLMSRSRGLTPLYASSREAIVSLILPYLLPSPCPKLADDDQADRDAFLVAVADFRRNHEHEFGLLRDAISAELHVDALSGGFTEATDRIRKSMSEPLAEIFRALELNRQLRLRSAGLKVLRHVEHGTIGLAVSTAAAAIAAPVVGDTIGLQSTAAAIIGGSVIGFTSMAASSASEMYRYRTAIGRIRRSPYRYIYDVGDTFGLPGNS